MLALLGKKIGMTQVIAEDGAQISATALEAGPCLVTDVRSLEKNGYKAAQIGYGDLKEKRVTKALGGQFKKKKLALKKYLREIRLDEKEEYKVGQEIKVDVFKPGDAVDVQGTTKGRGFAGGVKRWGWGGGPASHGSMFHKRIGSAGAASFPSRTWPGIHMPGHMGNAKKTVQNLQVLKVDAAKNLLVVRGAVPGPNEGLLFIRKSLKKPEGIKLQTAKKQVKDAGAKKTKKPKK